MRDYHEEVAFDRQVFGCDPREEEIDGYRYAGYTEPDSKRPIAGIGDEVESLAPGESPQWSVFWESADVDASVAELSALDGTVIIEPADGGLGRAATVGDPPGARFCIIQPKGSNELGNIGQGVGPVQCRVSPSRLDLVAGVRPAQTTDSAPAPGTR